MVDLPRFQRAGTGPYCRRRGEFDYVSRKCQKTHQQPSEDCRQCRNIEEKNVKVLRLLSTTGVVDDDRQPA